MGWSCLGMSLAWWNVGSWELVMLHGKGTAHARRKHARRAREWSKLRQLVKHAVLDRLHAGVSLLHGERGSSLRCWQSRSLEWWWRHAWLEKEPTGWHEEKERNSKSLSCQVRSWKEGTMQRTWAHERRKGATCMTMSCMQSEKGNSCWAVGTVLSTCLTAFGPIRLNSKGRQCLGYSNNSLGLLECPFEPRFWALGLIKKPKIVHKNNRYITINKREIVVTKRL